MITNKLVSLAGAAVLAVGLGAGCALIPGAPGTPGSGGEPPCAPAGTAGDYAADTEHPERAPLQAEASFDDGVRWAVCGASPVFGSDLLNLRSDDDGATWVVTDTGLDMTPSHAGDVVEVELADASSGTIRLASLVGETDTTYRSDDGGLTWQPMP
jgi:hypothetical protein